MFSVMPSSSLSTNIRGLISAHEYGGFARLSLIHTQSAIIAGPLNPSALSISFIIAFTNPYNIIKDKTNYIKMIVHFFLYKTTILYYLYIYYFILKCYFANIVILLHHILD